MKEKTKNVYAILYKRQLLQDGYMIFIPSYYSDGVYDSVNQTFTDNGGNPYHECDNYDTIISTEATTFFYDITPQDVTNRYQVDNVVEAMSMFYEEIQKTVLIGHIDNNKRLVEIFELPYNRVKDFCKSIEYSMNGNEGSINITKSQLISLLRETDPKMLKTKLSSYLTGTKILEKYNNIANVDNITMNYAGTKVSYFEVSPNTRVNIKKAENAIEDEISKNKFEIKRNTIIDTYNKITSSLVGQDECVQDLLSTIINNEYATDSKELIRPLLIGQTGSGKTLFFTLLSQILEKPVIKINCNHIVQSGYQGQDIESVVKRIYLLSGSDINAAEHAIVFLDEIDKLASRGASVSDIGAQQALLNFITGDKYVVDLDKTGMNKVTIDTTMMNICAGGTFEGLTYNKKNNLGFGNTIKEEIKNITNEDLVEYGMISELIGRFDQIIQYNPITEEMIKEQLTSSELSPIKIKQDYFLKNYKASIEFSNEFINRVCRQASNTSSGFRGAKKIINNSLTKLNFALQCEPLGDKFIFVDESIIDNPKQFSITKTKK